MFLPVYGLALVYFHRIPSVRSTNVTWVDYSFYTNSSPISFLKSFSLRENPLADLVSRQEEICSGGPGGPICSATTCCAAGRICCPDACCPDDTECLGTTNCCPLTGKICGGSDCCQASSVCCSQSPTGCCIAGAQCCQSSNTPCCPPEYSCCGDTCCAADEICEQDTCIPEELKDNVVRFDEEDEDIFLLLKNMCNGMRGKNVDTLTYSGPATGKAGKSAKAAKRRSAGCKDRFCANQIAQGLVPSAWNSCDEYPPASSDEGGDFLPAIQRAINCIPAAQNTFQGVQFSKLVTSTGLVKGDKFVISINCDKVLGSIVPRADISTSGTQSNISHLTNNDTTGYIIIPFGDLEAGTYSGSVKVITGETTEAFIIDSDGDNYTDNPLPALSEGQTQQFNFNLDEESVGPGIILVTKDNTTNVTWTFEGTLTSATISATSSSTSNSANTGVTSGEAFLGSGLSIKFALELGLAIIMLSLYLTFS